MARFQVDIDNGMLKAMEKMERGAPKIMEEMVSAGADVVERNVRSNMRASFKSTRSLERGLIRTRVFKTPSDDGIAVKVGFAGYDSTGVPIPLIAGAREKGTKRGEAKKPFFRKSFNKAQINSAMQKVEPKLYEGVN